MLRELGVRGGGLNGYFGEQGLPAGTQKCLERIRCGALTFSGGGLFGNGTARFVKVLTTSLLMELVGVATYSFEGWMCEAGRHKTAFKTL